MIKKIKKPKLTLGDLNFSYDLSTANFEIDALQQKLLDFYIRADNRFRRAYYLDYTLDFFQFIKDKVRLQEPIHLSIMGQTRSGKSYSGITIAVIINLLNNRMMEKKYICENKFDYLQKVKSMPFKDLHNSCFLIDEDKTAVFGSGSMAKKMKLQDVQNIIAKANISTISLTPTKLSNPDAFYGLRTFGRDFSQKVNRFMLYNMQEGDKGGLRPMGMVYIPIFTRVLPEPYAEKLQKDYEQMKDAWIKREERGEADVLMNLKRQEALNLLKDKIYKEIKKQKQKFVYVSAKLGSEWTRSEIEEIITMADMLGMGYDL